MSKDFGDKWIVANEKGLSMVRPFVKSKRSCNSYSYSNEKCINVGYDTKPDSDWGRFTRIARVIVTNPDLFEQTTKEIEKGLGWS